MKIYLCALAALTLSGCSGMAYIAENGIGQWKMFNRARPVEEVLESPTLAEPVRRAIRLVGEAKQYAVADLGLKATKNYEKFVQLDGPCVVWAVSAADPLELKEKKWKFPIVGEIPYLGFFKKTSAEGEAKRLEKEIPVPDTWVRCVPAFSSLGWFSDPLYSSMLKGNERDIVDLVIHESLHATVWVGNNVDFNEKLANFVGLEGSLSYVQKVKGAAGLVEAKKEVEGEKVFADFMQGAVAQYKSRVRTLDDKRAFYAELPESYQRFTKAEAAKRAFTPLPVKLANWNNAALLAYGNYYADFSVFESMLKRCEGSVRRFVAWIAAAQAQDKGRFKKAPEEALAVMAKSENCPKD